MGDAGDELSNRSHFFGVNQFVAQLGGIRNVGHDHDDAVDIVLLVAHGAEVDGEMADMAVAAHDLHFQIIDLSPAQNGRQRFGERARESGRGQLEQRPAQKFALFKASFVPAAIGIADKAGGVGDQNQALCVAENFAGEVALALQFGLIGMQAGNIEHETANLHQAVRECHTFRRH